MLKAIAAATVLLAAMPAFAQMCRQSADPAQCEARAKARAEKRKRRLEQHQKK